MADWALQYGGVRHEFGAFRSPMPFSEAPEVEIADVITADVQSPRSDGLLMGADLLAGGKVTLQMHVVGDTREEALALLEQLRVVWRADSIRRTPGAVAELVSDRARSAFGRPRRFSADLANEWDGMIQVAADFQAVTDLWFGPHRENTIRFAPGEGGGFVFPLVFPATTTATADRSQVIEVGGEIPTPYLQFKIKGPITNPMVDVLGVCRMEFRTTLAYDETLVVDARPWVQTIKVGSASRAGALTPASDSIRDVRLTPGSHEIVLRGIDATGTSSLTTTWRDAFATP